VKPWQLTRCAERSLAEILAWTIKRFGEHQAMAYRDALIERIDAIAAGLPPHPRPCGLSTRKFHQPATATANHHAVARSAPVCQLNVEQTTPSLPNGPRTAPRRALGGLATHVDETSGFMRGHPGAADLVYYREGGHYIVMRDSDEVLIVLEFFHQASDLPRLLQALE
jgi:plasmid stabilization system protein ParE